MVGALINGVFLLALCFMIYIEAIQRFFEPVVIEDPVLVLIVGGVGLLVNVIGLFIFHGGCFVCMYDAEIVAETPDVRRPRPRTPSSPSRSGEGRR